MTLTGIPLTAVKYPLSGLLYAGGDTGTGDSKTLCSAVRGAFMPFHLSALVSPS